MNKVKKFFDISEKFKIIIHCRSARHVHFMYYIYPSLHGIGSALYEPMCFGEMTYSAASDWLCSLVRTSLANSFAEDRFTEDGFLGALPVPPPLRPPE
jgi:hypothetical protein